MSHTIPVSKQPQKEREEPKPEPEVFKRMKRNGLWSIIEKEVMNKNWEIMLTLRENPNASWRRKWLTEKIIDRSHVTLRYYAAVSNILLEKYKRYGLK